MLSCVAACCSSCGLSAVKLNENYIKNSALWQNGGSDPDAIWHHRSDGRYSGVWARSTGKGTFGGEFGARLVTNGDFTAYVCDSAAKRPSSKITLGKLVIIITIV